MNAEDKDAYEGQRNALHSIPLILERQPADARDLCAPLLRELIRLNNSFNMEVRGCARAEDYSKALTYTGIRAASHLSHPLDARCFSRALRSGPTVGLRGERLARDRDEARASGRDDSRSLCSVGDSSSC